MPKNDFQPDRRALLKGSLLMLPAMGTGIGLIATAGADEAPPHIDDYTPTFFSTEEWQFILAATDRLIPEDETGAGALGTNVPIFLDLQLGSEYGSADNWYMEGPFPKGAPAAFGYQLPFTPAELYRYGIAATRRYCQDTYQADFPELDAKRQIEVLSGLENGDIHFAPQQGRELPSATFFSFLLKNTKEGYFADPQYGGNKHMGGWKMLGFTGARASFREWVDQYDRPYPLGPVSLSGERG